MLLQNIKKLIPDSVGFEFTETMSGEHQFMPGYGPDGYFPFEFKVVWGPDNVIDWINPKKDSFLTQNLKGIVTVQGLCQNCPCNGTLTLDYIKHRSIRYDFTFIVNQTEYRYIGEKVNILPWNLTFSHTTCFGVVTNQENGKLISRSVTYFKANTIPSFITSFRLTFSKSKIR